MGKVFLYNVSEILECGGGQFPGKESKILEPIDKQRKNIASLQIRPSASENLR